MGAGLVLDGALYRGTRAAAGEIGHVVVDPDGAPCTCGRVGCLETVIEPALHADTLDAALTRRAGDQLGTALATVLSTLDLHDVVVSGAERATTDEFRGAVRDAIAARTMDEISDQLTVNRSSLGDHDIVLGAAALVLDAELGLR